MRIITGSAKGRRLETLPGLVTRPTAERTKEAVFSMIQFSLEGRKVLDLFAGSGQMGLEALSRGASETVFIDNSPEAAAIIKKNAESTGLSDRCRILKSSVKEALLRLKGEKFDIVFADPPYALGLLPGTLDSLLENDLLKKTSTVICESSEAGDVFGEGLSSADGFETIKQNRYGAALITVLKMPGKAEEI